MFRVESARIGGRFVLFEEAWSGDLAVSAPGVVGRLLGFSIDLRKILQLY